MFSTQFSITLKLRERDEKRRIKYANLSFKQEKMNAKL